MIGKKQIAAVVVTYNCDIDDLIRNINSYKEYVSTIYLCDNSDGVELSKSKEIQAKSNVTYVSMNGNKGIAYALNRGCEIALRDGYEWVLTMDHDSQFATDLSGYLDVLNNPEYKKVSLLCPSYIFYGEPASNDNNFLVTAINKCIQSGCLLSLSTFKQLGGFEEKYFIDYVDYEYCMRIIKHGHIIIKTPSVKLMHHRGTLCERKLFGRKYVFAYSSPLRVYYQTRNSLDYYRKYRDKEDFISRVLIISRMILLEENRCEKLKYFFIGIKDYIRGKWYSY